MYIDTHTHLYDEHLAADPEQIKKAVDAGVTLMYMPNCDSGTIAPMLQLADAHPEHCKAMMGVHPTYIKENWQSELQICRDWLSKRKFAAIGEIGLDYYWDLTFKEQQITAFKEQIDLAIQYDLPIVIHSRESTADCIEIVKAKLNGKLTGIFHCFSGTVEEAKEIVSMGFYLGIGGVVTYKKTNLPDVIKEVGLEHIVLETDAPYLAPAPYRGRRNQSAYIPAIAGKIGDILGISAFETGQTTTANARRVFGT
jgi:TatD DNase family protein